MSTAQLNEQPSLDWFISKKYFFALTLLAPLFPLVSALVAADQNQGLWLWLTGFIYFFFVPIADIIFGKDTHNPNEEQQAELKDDRFYVHIMYVATVLHWGGLIATTYAVTSMDLAWYHVLGAIISIGAMHAIGLTMSHELGHRINERDQVWAAKLVIACCAYAHFNIEHNKGHHKHVATPEDPASSRMGENLYKFALRELPGAFTRAWELEGQRLARKGHSTFSIHNEILHSWMFTFIGFGAMIAAFGITALPFLLVASAYGWFQLTMANYIEHYGLVRQKLENGRFERCQPKHSWNSNFRVSNLLSLHLQRHSDHHANPTRQYQLLRDYPEAPQMPTGYPTMMMISMMPPVWFAVMNRKVSKWANGDMTLVNMDPQAKEAMFQRYHFPPMIEATAKAA